MKWFIAAVILLLLGLVVWRVSVNKAASQALQQQTRLRTGGPVSVSVAVAGPKDLDQGLDAVGTLQSPYSVKISPKVQGLIDFLQVQEGDPVAAGQVLIRLNPDTTAANVDQNVANLEAARQKYDEAKLTQDPADVGVGAAIRQAVANVQTSRANLGQETENAAAKIAAAQASVTDNDAKIAQAQAGLASAKANKQSAQATRKDAQTKLKRQLELFKQNYIAAQDVDDQRTAVAVAAAAVNVAQKGIDAANQAVKSAQALRGAAQNQLDIVKKQENATIAVDRAALDSSLQTLKLARSNTAQIGAYKENLAALDSAVRAAQSQLDASKILAGDLTITSPIDGVVTARTLDPGSIAQPGAAVLTVQYMKWLYFNAGIPVEQSASVRVGQPAAVTLDAVPGQTFHGVIAKLNPAADPTSHQFTVLVKLDNPGNRLRPGMYGALNVTTKKVRAAVVVPREAVTTNADGTNTVTVVDAGNVAHVVPVVVGMQDSGDDQILSGVKAGDRVVSLTFKPVKDGAKVVVNGQSISGAHGFSVNGIDGSTPPVDPSAQPVDQTPSGGAPPSAAPAGVDPRAGSASAPSGAR